MHLRRYIVVAMCLPLMSCGNGDSFRETLGLNRKGPDEFQVFQRPPLTVPPEFNLTVPKQGAEYAIGAPSDQQAHNIVAGAQKTPGAPLAPTAVPAVTSGNLPGGADAQFLSDAGAAKANRNIRQLITNDNDNGVAAKDSKYLLGTSTDDPLVDPTKESDRLKQDKAQNKSPTTGDTPVVPPQSKGLLGDLF